LARRSLCANPLGGTLSVEDTSVTSAVFRKLALQLPDVEERAHMGHPDFRVGGRVFATLGYPRRGWAMVKLRPEEQAVFIAMRPDIFVPVKGTWGEQGCTNISLRHATVGAARAALRAAHEAQTPPRGRASRARAV
jgi:hypothetical protein